jgi:hypothetical protein
MANFTALNFIIYKRGPNVKENFWTTFRAQYLGTTNFCPLAIYLGIDLLTLLSNGAGYHNRGGGLPNKRRPCST